MLASHLSSKTLAILGASLQGWGPPSRVLRGAVALRAPGGNAHLLRPTLQGTPAGGRAATVVLTSACFRCFLGKSAHHLTRQRGAASKEEPKSR